jgi:hypothetical protein
MKSFKEERHKISVVAKGLFSQDRRLQVSVDQAFVEGAKLGAIPVQRLGEIIQQYAPNLPRSVVEELRMIFENIKEIVDEN